MTMLTNENFLRARVTMGRRLSARRAERFSRPIYGEDEDHADMTLEVDDPVAPPIAFHLIYEDAHNTLSGRNFTLRTLRSDWNDIRLSGICHLRQALRTFLASRVVEVTDLATGEISEDGLEYFGHHPMLQGLSADGISKLSLSAIAVQDCRDEVIILSFLAAADEDFCEAEEDQIVTYVLDRACDPAVSEVEVRRRIRDYVPDELAFDRALNRLCAGAGDVHGLLRSMRRVIDADGEVDAEEVAFAEEIEARLVTAGRL